MKIEFLRDDLITTSCQQQALIRMAVGHYQFSALRNLSALTITHVRQAAPKIDSRELVDVIFDLPYCRIQKLVERDIAGRQAASRCLKQLVEIGVLEERTVGRDKLFIHPKLMHLLTRDENAVTAYS